MKILYNIKFSSIYSTEVAWIFQRNPRSHWWICHILARV